MGVGGGGQGGRSGWEVRWAGQGSLAVGKELMCSFLPLGHSLHVLSLPTMPPHTPLPAPSPAPPPPRSSCGHLETRHHFIQEALPDHPIKVSDPSCSY